MFIKYTKANLHTLATHDGKELAHLRPGWNEFPSRVWDENKNDAEIKRMIEDGDIVLMEDRVEQKVGKKKIVKIIGKTDEPVALKDLDEKRAIEVAGETFNLDMLQRWMDEETRHKVKRAIDKQVKAINSKGGSPGTLDTESA